MTVAARPPSLAAILPAAGRSSRFGGGNKLFQPLCGVPVLARALAPFLAMPEVRQVVIATGEEAAVRRMLEAAHIDARGKLTFCAGGPTRAHSVRNALACVEAGIEWIAVHDAARPLVTVELIQRTFRAAIEHGAAAPALPVDQTIKQANGPLPACVLRTVPRQSLWAMQTPQIMRRADLESAFARCGMPLEHITDDIQLLEISGHSVWLVAGETSNIKITTAIDLKIAEMLLTEGLVGNSGQRQPTGDATPAGA